MNVRCNCGHYYNTDVYNNVCPECEQTYKDENEEIEKESQYIDIDKYIEKLVMLGNFYKGGKLDIR